MNFFTKVNFEPSELDTNIGTLQKSSHDGSIEKNNLTYLRYDDAKSLESVLDRFNHDLENEWWRREQKECYDKRDLGQFETCMTRKSSMFKQNIKQQISQVSY